MFISQSQRYVPEPSNPWVWLEIRSGIQQMLSSPLQERICELFSHMGTPVCRLCLFIHINQWSVISPQNTIDPTTYISKLCHITQFPVGINFILSYLMSNRYFHNRSNLIKNQRSNIDFHKHQYLIFFHRILYHT